MQNKRHWLARKSAQLNESVVSKEQIQSWSQNLNLVLTEVNVPPQWTGGRKDSVSQKRTESEGNRKSLFLSIHLFYDVKQTDA